MSTILLSILIILAYLLGSLSSAIFVCRVLKLPDPRSTGSNNPGATNVLRIGGKLPALLTLLGDVLKGFLPVIIGRIFGFSPFELGFIAAAAVLGHIFPVFFNFKGGKGVATFIGAMFGLSLLCGIVTLVVWIAVAAVTRYSSLASLCAVATITLFSPFFLRQFAVILPMLLLAAIITLRHYSNIMRLRDGTETKINFGAISKAE